MNLDNLACRIANASFYGNDPELSRKLSFWPLGLVALIGVVPGFVMKSYWLYLTIALLVITISCVLIVNRITLSALTVERSLILDVIISGTCFLTLCILEFMYFTIWKGFNFGILFVYLPPISVLLLLGIAIHKVTMKDSEFNPTKKSSNIKFGGAGLGTIGANLGALIAANLDQDAIYIVALSCLSIVNCFMSLGLLSAQQLFYLKKYKLYERVSRIANEKEVKHR